MERNLTQVGTHGWGLDQSSISPKMHPRRHWKSLKLAGGIGNEKRVEEAKSTKKGKMKMRNPHDKKKPSSRKTRKDRSFTLFPSLTAVGSPENKRGRKEVKDRDGKGRNEDCREG